MPPTIRYRVSLVCSHCDNLNDERNIDLATSGLGADPIDTSAYLGSTLELALEDFADGFLTLRTPADDEQTLIALEIWAAAYASDCRSHASNFVVVHGMSWSSSVQRPARSPRKHLAPLTTFLASSESGRPNRATTRSGWRSSRRSYEHDPAR